MVLIHLLVLADCNRPKMEGAIEDNVLYALSFSFLPSKRNNWYRPWRYSWNLVSARVIAAMKDRLDIVEWSEKRVTFG